MGLLDIIFAKKKEHQEVNNTVFTKSIVSNMLVDLKELSFNKTVIGTQLPESDPINEALSRSGLYKPDGEGIEVGVKNGLLDHVYITLNEFCGRINYTGTVSLSNATVDKVLNIFGEPYWTDKDEDETILFYEFNSGTIEVQFEFDSNDELLYILIANEGVLFQEDQRESYGVDKPWPPQN